MSACSVSCSKKSAAGETRGSWRESVCISGIMTYARIFTGVCMYAFMGATLASVVGVEPGQNASATGHEPGQNSANSQKARLTHSHGALLRRSWSLSSLLRCFVAFCELLLFANFCPGLCPVAGAFFSGSTPTLQRLGTFCPDSGTPMLVFRSLGVLVVTVP